MRGGPLATALLLAALAGRSAPAQTAREVLWHSETPGTRLGPRLDPPVNQTADFARPAPETAPVALPLPKYGAWVGVTKWLTLASTIGFGALGIKLHNDADRLFDQLDQLCQADADNCRSRNPDGSYADPLLESMYQDVLSKDRRARASFVGAELTFGASVVLFIVDFQKRKGPGNVPYNPDEKKGLLRLTARPGQLALRYYPR